MNTHIENEMVITALVGRPVPWSGNLPPAEHPDPETEAVARMLIKRKAPAAPNILARLTGIPRRDVNKHLGRLQRAGIALPVGNGDWVAA